MERENNGFSNVKAFLKKLLIFVIILDFFHFSMYRMAGFMFYPLFLVLYHYIYNGSSIARMIYTGLICIGVTFTIYGMIIAPISAPELFMIFCIAVDIYVVYYLFSKKVRSYFVKEAEELSEIEKNK